ncbi:hypothetical protein D3C75_1052000 [compost metagenome]
MGEIRRNNLLNLLFSRMIGASALLSQRQIDLAAVVLIPGPLNKPRFNQPIDNRSNGTLPNRNSLRQKSGSTQLLAVDQPHDQKLVIGQAFCHIVPDLRINLPGHPHISIYVAVNPLLWLSFQSRSPPRKDNSSPLE